VVLARQEHEPHETPAVAPPSSSSGALPLVTSDQPPPRLTGC
jgi:hypothetical protein